MKRIDISEAEEKLSSLIQLIEDGKETSIHLTKHGKTVAELHPPSYTNKSRERGCLADPAFSISSDFDASESGFENFYSSQNSTTTR